MHRIFLILYTAMSNLLFVQKLQKRFASRNCLVRRLKFITMCCSIRSLKSESFIFDLIYTGNFNFWILLPGREIYFLGLLTSLLDMYMKLIFCLIDVFIGRVIIFCIHVYQRQLDLFRKLRPCLNCKK